MEKRKYVFWLLESIRSGGFPSIQDRVYSRYLFIISSLLLDICLLCLVLTYVLRTTVFQTTAIHHRSEDRLVRIVQIQKLSKSSVSLNVWRASLSICCLTERGNIHRKIEREWESCILSTSRRQYHHVDDVFCSRCCGCFRGFATFLRSSSSDSKKGIVITDFGSFRCRNDCCQWSNPWTTTSSWWSERSKQPSLCLRI